ncbi:MAG: GreA/GreB family elongation factor [Bacteroidales bacterium]|nr:GreA/GreB family elongation factor [Bacteroidales bacterium]
MSRGFIKEGDQEEIPMVPLRAYLPEGVPNYVTKEGLAALNEELKSLESERAKAGDNYIMGNFIEAKMKLLISRINSAVEIDLSKANKETVSFGAWVRYNGRVVRIVGVDEADIDKGLISFISPLAKSLTGKKAGEILELKGPKGTERITVEEVSFEPLALTQMVSDKHTGATATTEGKDQRTVKKKLVQLDQPQEEAREDDIDLSAAADEPCRFEPEVNYMEFLPIVNERGNIVGRALHLELHKGNKMLHPVVHLHVLSDKGETTGRYWWHVAFGDTPEKTLQRKTQEVLGLSGVKPLLKRQYIRETKTEKELVYVFTVVSEESLPQTPEGKDYREVFEKD